MRRLRHEGGLIRGLYYLWLAGSLVWLYLMAPHLLSAVTGYWKAAHGRPPTAVTRNGDPLVYDGELWIPAQEVSSELSSLQDIRGYYPQFEQLTDLDLIDELNARLQEHQDIRSRNLRRHRRDLVRYAGKTVTPPIVALALGSLAVLSVRVWRGVRRTMGRRNERRASLRQAGKMHQPPEDVAASD